MTFHFTHNMSEVLDCKILKFDYVVKILTEGSKWDLPLDLCDKAHDFLKITKDDFSTEKFASVSSFLNCFEPVFQVALINTAAFFSVEHPKISKTLLLISQELPDCRTINSKTVEGSIFDINKTKVLSDDDFNKFLTGLYPDLAKEFNLPFVTAAYVLVTGVLMERVVDYALVSYVLSAEFAEPVPSALSPEKYSRENAPRYVSLVCQRVCELTASSRTFKKKGGSDYLEALPVAFGPTAQAIAQISSATFKPNFFISLSLLKSYMSCLRSSAADLFDFLGIQTPADVNSMVLELAKYVVTRMSELGQKLQTAVENKTFRGNNMLRCFGLEFVQQGIVRLSTLVLPTPEQKYEPKVPNGTRDFEPKQMKIRERVIGLVSSVFKRHGGVPIDTPVFENRDTLESKYGADAKLIYNLEDQGGDLLSLRYDLTVPFARYLACHKSVSSMRRYHIAKVYRRDKPAADRFREFYQCDFDIAGKSGTMVADAEILSIFNDLFIEIGNHFGQTLDYEIRVSHRDILRAMTKVAGVQDEKFKTVCSTIDKLDKMDWSKVRDELINVKGLNSNSADIIGEYVNMKKKLNLDVRGEKSCLAVLDKLKNDPKFSAVAEKTLKDMDILFSYLKNLNCIDHISFDLSIARGLDYYTGIIFEASVAGKASSVVGGGRYDTLVGMLCGRDVPSVGASLGIERIFTLFEEKFKESGSESDVQVYVGSVQGDFTEKRFELCSKLWASKISTQMSMDSNPKTPDQIKQAAKLGARVICFVGESEIQKKVVKVRYLADSDEEKEERDVPENEFVDEIKRRLKKFDE